MVVQSRYNKAIISTVHSFQVFFNAADLYILTLESTAGKCQQDWVQYHNFSYGSQTTAPQLHWTIISLDIIEFSQKIKKL